MLPLIAQAQDLTTKDYNENLRNLIFLGGFVLLAIIVFIWWLRRG